MPLTLTDPQRRLLDQERRATLATTSTDGRPRLVPVCYAVAPAPPGPVAHLVVYSPLDEKPKRTNDPKGLARVRDILVLPEAALLVDHWDEDWSRLAWLRLQGAAELLEPQPHEEAEHLAAVGLLRARYPQYQAHALQALPMIRIRVDRVVAWAADGF